MKFELKILKENLKRILVELILFIILLLLFLTGYALDLPATAQWLLSKVICVNLGFLHAHIVRKLAFPKIDWQGEINAGVILTVSLYCVFILAYAVGGLR